VSERQDLPFIPFARPSLGREEEEAVLAVMRTGWLTTGEAAVRFEEEFAQFAGSRHALALCSATAGLHLCLEALGVGPGTAVITTPYTFAATAEVIRYMGADPLFVDIDRETLNIDPAAMRRALEERRRAGGRVSAMIPVHVAGLPCDMEAIGELSREFGVPVVEDAAHAFPVRTGGRFVGTIGDAGVYSFYATKPITTGEGGMVVTDRDDLARRIRLMRLHGIDRDIWNRYTSAAASWRYDVVAPGFKYNLTDMAAAIGRVQLAKAQALLERRRLIARRYGEAFRGIDELVSPPAADGHAWHLFIVRLRHEALSIDRDRFIEELQARRIGVSVHFIPLHLMSYYRETYGHRPEDFPIALECYRACVSLPLYPSMTDEEVGRVVAAVSDVCRRFRRAQ
jgi:dTDP-4-amino-4,6-dideoxygalactose transaminase